MKENKARLGKEYHIFVIVALAFAVTHLAFPLKIDDLGRVNAAAGQSLSDVLRSAWEFTQARSARLVIHFILYPLLWLPHCKIVWAALDGIAIYIIMVGLTKLFAPRKELYPLVVLMVCMYPFVDMANAGIVSTTVGYLWILAAMLTVMVNAKRVCHGERLRKYELALYAILAFCAGNQEQTCVIMLTVFLVLTVFEWRKPDTQRIFWVISLVACAINVRLCFFSYASTHRMETETYWFPDYARMSLMNKVEMAFTSTMDRIIFEEGLFIVMALVICAVVWMKYKERLFRTTAVLPVVISVMGRLNKEEWNIFQTFSKTVNANVSAKIRMNYGLVDVTNYDSWKTYLPVLVMVLVGGLCLLNLWLLSEAWKEFVLTGGMLVLGMASRMMMGFSPSIWASSTRTYVFLWFSIIAVTLWICNQYASELAGLCGKLHIKDGVRVGLPIASAMAFLNYFMETVQYFSKR